jgi:hypothetical protein
MLKTITTSLKDILLRLNLTIDDCLWQTYDGAANMAGSRSAVAARISSENPGAMYIHCGNHSLDLALHDCVEESEIIIDTLKAVAVSNRVDGKNQSHLGCLAQLRGPVLHIT